jgi:hypothetical protein
MFVRRRTLGPLLVAMEVAAVPIARASDRSTREDVMKLEMQSPNAIKKNSNSRVERAAAT